MGNGNRETPAAKEPNEHLEQVKLLFDYTKFHIGLYTTLASLLVATLGADFAKDWDIDKRLVGVAILMIAGAGLCGGVIASSLPVLAKKPDTGDLYSQCIGPYNSAEAKGLLKKILSHSLRWWTYGEHSCFWIAVILVLYAFSPVVLTEKQKGGDPAPSSIEVSGYDSVKVTR